MNINRHLISKDMQKSKLNDKAFFNRMDKLENLIKENENKGLEKLEFYSSNFTDK